MIPAEKVIIALDTQDQKKLDALFRDLEGERIWVKVGMEVFYALGPQVIFQAKEKGFNVFLDLKLHDIPNTVSQALKALCKLPIDMVNVHAAGGSQMLESCAEALSTLSKKPLLIAVTQLTSTTQGQMNNDQRIPGLIEDSVLHFAKLAHAARFDGIVCSPLEVGRIKKELGLKFLTVTPGIRPAGTENNDQKRVTTPTEALALGTDFMVIGRPITGAPDPKKILQEILRGN